MLLRMPRLLRMREDRLLPRLLELRLDCGKRGGGWGGGGGVKVWIVG